MPRLDGRLARFALGVAVLLGLLLFPWPGVGPAFTSGFCRFANGLSADLRWHSIIGVDFEPSQGGGAEASARKADWSATVKIRNTQTGGATPAFALDLRSLAYVSLSVLVAMALAAPNRGNRVWLRSQLLGLALVGGFAVLSIALAITWGLSHVWIADPNSLLDGDPVHLVRLGAAGQWVVGALHGATAATGGPTAFVLWILAWKLTAPGGGWPWSEPAAAKADSPAPPRRGARRGGFGARSPGGSRP